MFSKGSDNALWHLVWDGTLHSWESLGGALTGDPDCTSPGPSMIDCLARGSDNALWHIALNNSAWNTWESVGGVLASGPGATSGSPGGHKLVIVFVKALDGAMWDMAWTGGKWGKFDKEGGILTSDPDAVASYDPQDIVNSNRVDIVVRGADNGNWWKWWRVNVGWSTGCQGCDGYESLSGISNSGLTIVSRAWNNLDVFALGTDNKLYHRGWDGNTWSSWDAVPMDIAVASTSLSNSSMTSTSSPTTIINSTPIQESSTTQTSSAQTLTQTGSTDFMGILQQNGLLVIVSVVLILVLGALLSRGRRK